MKKRRNQIKRCINKTITGESRLVTNKDDSAHEPQQLIPDEVFVEHILTRLAVQTLKDSSFVCKLWYNSIYKDPQFASLHLQQSKKNPTLRFHLLNFYVRFMNLKHLSFSVDLDGDKGGHYDYNTLANNVGILGDTTDNLVFHKVSTFTTLNEIVLVNYCDGFGCFTQSCPRRASFMIQNPSWGREILKITCPHKNNYIKSCYGFGFDSVTNEYKVVTVLCNSKHLNGGGDSEELFKGLVYTLGSCLWREIDSSSLVAGCAPSGIRMSRMSYSGSAIFVGGFLCWRIFTRGVDKDDEREMLLLFDLHDENFQFVCIPAECASTSTAERMQVVDHLLVIKGSPCVLVFEKLLLTSGHHFHHVNHPQERRNGPLCCCCCCKIHLYVLKDITKQVWIKETVDVCTTNFSSLSSSWLSLTKSCCCCLDGTASPPRILSLSDRVLLYWFDGICLQLFDPWKNNLKVVKCSRDDDRKTFEDKMKHHHIQDVVENHADTCNTNTYSADIQLIAEAENFSSLRAFIPKGAKTTNSADILCTPYTGYIMVLEASRFIAFAF